MLIDINLGPIIYKDEDIYITEAHPNIGNDGTNDYLDQILTLVDTELGGKVYGDTGNVSNAVLIADGTNGDTLKASINVVIDNDGQLSVGGTESSAMVDITQRLSDIKVLEVNGIENRSVPLLQINEGSGTPTENLLEINSNSETGGDILSVKEDGYLGVNTKEPGKHLDVNGDVRAIDSLTVGISYWEQVGNGLDAGQLSFPSMAPLSSTDVAFVDLYGDRIYTYQFDGTDWSQVGNSLFVGGTYHSIAGLNSTDISWINSASKQLRTYRFDGTNWSQVGNGLNLPSIGNPFTTGLNSTDIVMADDLTDTIRIYRFDGTDWFQVGNALNVGSIGYGAMSALSNDTIAFIELNGDKLKTYRFDGTDWSQVGNDFYVGNSNYQSLAALNGTDVAWISNGIQDLRIYRFDGTDWAQLGPDLNIPGTGTPAIVYLGNNKIAFVDHGNEELRTYEFINTITLKAEDYKVGFCEEAPRSIVDVRGNGSTDILRMASSNGERFLSLNANGYFGIGKLDPETLVELSHTQPYLSLYNLTKEDISNGRESEIIFRGTQSGGEVSRLAVIQVSHDGTSDDQKAKITFYINDGDDGDNPTERMVLNSLGYVGLNQSLPSAVFDVVQISSDVIGIEINGASNRIEPLLQLNEGSGTASSVNLLEINSFGGSNGDVFVINRDGVGINQSLPDEPLHINSTYDGNRGVRMQNESDGTSAVARYIVDIYGGSAFFAAYGSNFTTSGSKRANSASLITNTSMANGLSLVARHITGGHIRFYTGGNADANERGIIRADGKFGVGTNLPDKIFEINKSTGGELRLSHNAPTGSATDYCDLSVDDNGSLTVTTLDSDGELGHINLNPDGNVGINLSNPVQKFHIGGTTGDTFIAITDSSTGHTANNGIIIGLDSTNDGIFWNYENRDIVFGTNNLGRMRIFADGTVKIGDLSTNYSSFAPDGELTLHGTARSWTCVDLNPSNTGKPSANPPTDGEYQGHQFHRFDRSTEEQVYFTWHVPTDFAQGAASVRGHFGFLVENPPSGTGDEAVVMGFEYKKISPGDVFDFSSGTTSGTITETITDGESAYEWHETSTGTCVTTGWDKEDIILFRFYRDATNPNDTYDNEVLAANNDVWVRFYHLEYLRDSLGEGS